MLWNAEIQIAGGQGLPDDLKELIDTAHGMGITVLLDVVAFLVLKYFHLRILLPQHLSQQGKQNRE